MGGTTVVDGQRVTLVLSTEHGKLITGSNDPFWDRRCYKFELNEWALCWGDVIRHTVYWENATDSFLTEDGS